MTHIYRNYFKEIYLPEEDSEPAEFRLEESPEIQKLTEEILDAKKQMSTLLKQNIVPWLNLEEMLNKREALGEELYFNAGFEHGYQAGEAEALRMLSQREADGYRELGDKIRYLVLHSGLPRGLGIAALVENAWALALRASNED